MAERVSERAAGGGPPLACQRDAFSLDPNGHYLNCAFMSPLPQQVEAAGLAAIARKRDPGAMTPADFYADSDALRARFAALIGAPDPQRVAIVPSVSYGLGAVAGNLAWAPGRRVVVADGQFPSNVYPWRRLVRAPDDLVFVPPPAPGPGRGRGWNARILEAIDRRTGLVALGPVHWADGTRFDLEAIGARAREVGAAFAVDGTQAVGASPFDVSRIQPDALVCAGYKWLFGPYGIGLAYYGPRFDGGTPLEEGWIARRGSENFSSLTAYQDAYQPGALRYDVGERSSFFLVPMMVAALERVLDWGPARIQAYCAELLSPFLEAFERLGYWVEAPAWRGGHLFGLFTPPGESGPAVVERLKARGVSVSLRGEAIRVSLNVFNDESDLAALLAALQADGR